MCLGLGNPGAQYERTRHNVGFWIIEALAERLGLRFTKPFFSPWLIAENDRVLCIKPQTFMNDSGAVFAREPRFCPSDETRVIVVCDNMDLAPGELRLKQKGGTAGHNGLKSIVANIGMDFWPLYFGVGRPPLDSDVISHVLGTPEPEEMKVLSGAATRAVDGILALLDHRVEEVMNELNKRQTTSK